MGIKIFQPEDQNVTKWSGGQTTELFIFPEKSIFADRDFDFRISTASIEVEKSNFTPMTGFLRKIMVLDGELRLNHENHHSIELKQFEQDSFSGDWNTSSVGKAIDFNVIYRPEFQPEIEVIRCDASREIEIKRNQGTFLYLVKGTLRINETEIKPKSFVVLEESELTSFFTIENAVMIVVRI